MFDSMQELAEATQESTGQNETAAFSMEMTVEDETVEGTGEGRMIGASPVMSTSFEGMGKEWKARQLGLTTYLQLPEEDMPEDAVWLQASPDGDDQTS